jgi:hypothetical protein
MATMTARRVHIVCFPFIFIVIVCFPFIFIVFIANALSGESVVLRFSADWNGRRTPPRFGPWPAAWMKLSRNGGGTAVLYCSGWRNLLGSK